jgi:hypothetical protein
MYIGKLIEQIIRPKTGNVDFDEDATTGDTTEGISTDLILNFINHALAFLQSRIIAVYPAEFVEEDIQNTVTDQEEYDIDDNIFLKNKFISIEYSHNGDLQNYFPLPPAGLHQRDTSSGRPYQYIRRNGKILLNKIPNDSSGTLRVNYYRALDKLDIRRGQITSKTATTIVLDDDDWLDSPNLGDAQYICIVSNLGVVKDYNVLVSSYDSTTRTITIPSQTLVGIAGDYITIGKYTSTHLPADKPDRMLDYVQVVAQARIYNTDSSMDEINEKKEVVEILADIIDQFSEMTEDVMEVPIMDEALT